MIQYDYPFPNRKIVFWCFILVTLIFMVHSVEAFLFAFVPTFCCVILIFNSFPAVRVGSEGIEVQFFLFLFSIWKYIPWEEIDKVEYRESALHSLRVFKVEKDLMVYSYKLPIYYYFPSLIYNHKINRGFIIGRRMRNFEEIDETFKEKSLLLDQ